ncbi:uncharacterized protein LOC122405300 [Colletes gigas]|uniref:uncharacterized protein LOC122405300 n=1 Tax=Colletes gigas TaxID=935657 RepID=UPI001C9B451E|nr:uncharacterized protein LOC122405300 [Colletes gigas]
MKTSSILALVVVLYGLFWLTFIDASPTPSTTTGLELTDEARNVISSLWNEASGFRKTVMSYAQSLESKLTTIPREIMTNIIQYLRAMFKQVVSFFGLSGNSFLGFDINNTSSSGKSRRSIVTGIVYPTHNLLDRLT